MDLSIGLGIYQLQAGSGLFLIDWPMFDENGEFYLPDGWTYTGPSIPVPDENGTRNLSGVDVLPVEGARFSGGKYYNVDALGDPLPGPFIPWIVPESTNHFLNSATVATQTISSLPAGMYTMWVEGTGSIALSGDASGTATEGSPVHFTLASTGDVTCTLTGSLDIAQLNTGPAVFPYIATTGTAVTRSAADLELPTNLVNDTKGTYKATIYLPAHSSTEDLSLNVFAGLYIYSVDYVEDGYHYDEAAIYSTDYVEEGYTFNSTSWFSTTENFDSTAINDGSKSVDYGAVSAETQIELAASWGESEMNAYLDGSASGSNDYDGGFEFETFKFLINSNSPVGFIGLETYSYVVSESILGS